MSIYQLPLDLPAPVDDGATDHLVGVEVPQLELDSSQGLVDLAELAVGLAVLYIYPATGVPGRPSPTDGMRFPARAGARRNLAPSAITPLSSPTWGLASPACLPSPWRSRSSSRAGSTYRFR